MESKGLSIDSLRKEMAKTTDETKRAGLQEQIDALNAEIQGIYNGTETEPGLYAQMREAVEMAMELEDVRGEYRAALLLQQEIEQRFALTMGDMLIDGYWSNTNYAPGQEGLLYLEACEIMAQSCTLILGEQLKGKTPFYAGLDKVRFKHMVRPGDTIEVTAKPISIRGSLYVIGAEAKVDGKLACKGELTFYLMDNGQLGK